MSGPASPAGASRAWRAAVVLARLAVASVGRLRVSGAVPPGLRSGPLLLAANHVGPADPAVLVAAAARVGLAPRIMATAGVFRAPVLGWLMRRAGHVRVERRSAAVRESLAAAGAVLAAGHVVLVYPEGRIGLDPGLWPERGKTGTARLALRTGVPVVPVAQWGAHELLPYGVPRRLLRTLGRAVWRRPVLRVHFGGPVDLSGLSEGDAVEATERIVAAIAGDLVPLRAAEPVRPAWVDRTRPVSAARSRRAGDGGVSGR
ncbi:1-acyl-sn-glycerol-3-phosphate acyltransferase [Pilimelia terevasa]|uniref:1-acyl-sn-glycerol-3-phosphate acyltransferase n=1 Tax=Pilimelia terevasa TaxID=53372 RepID=A0A8J3BP68_9ACTN|nr:lysophospholipid acyltransferase family protein [Pilimelia terevasa]GGK37356.1 1-acyl-sn-glycerol-3-phosphate acyltransferase [Pilimelia terevasa]